MPIRVSSNISSHGTITGESIVALAIRPRMKCMPGVWHKSRNFSVHHIVLRPGYKIINDRLVVGVLKSLRWC